MRSLLDLPPEDVTLDGLAAALDSAGDEDDRWEAKGGDHLRAEHVFRPVAGLANRAGGLLVLGANRRADGAWSLDGTRFSAEPGTWIGRVIRDNLRPPPPTRLAVFEVAAGRHVALVRVERHPSHLSVTSDGRVLVREQGSTEPIDDGAELTRVIRARSGTGAAAPLDPAAGPDELADAALGAIEHGGEARLRSFIAGLQGRLPRAAEFAPQAELDAEMDRLSAVSACLAQAVPESPVTAFALAAHHRAFDAAAIMRPIPAGHPNLDLERALLRNTRALGALLVRLELWPLVRKLVDHDAPDPKPIPAG